MENRAVSSDIAKFRPEPLETLCLRSLASSIAQRVESLLLSNENSYDDLSECINGTKNIVSSVLGGEPDETLPQRLLPFLSPRSTLAFLFFQLAFAEHLNTFTPLSELSVRPSKRQYLVWPYLNAAFKLLPSSITQLDLATVSVHDFQFNTLATSTVAATLRRLDLSCSQITDAVSSKWQLFTSLERLNISDAAQIRLHSIEAISSLPRLRKLIKICTKAPKFNYQTAVECLLAPEALPDLQVLKFRLTDEDTGIYAHHILNLISKRDDPTQIEVLDLDLSFYAVSSALFYTRLAELCPNLRQLPSTIESHDRDKGKHVPASLLFPHLTELTIQYRDEVSEDESKQLALTHPHLKHLKIQSSRFSISTILDFSNLVSLECVVASLEYTLPPMLRRLRVESSQVFSPEQIARFVQGLKDSSPPLTKATILFDNCFFSKAQIQDILDSFPLLEYACIRFDGSSYEKDPVFPVSHPSLRSLPFLSELEPFPFWMPSFVEVYSKRRSITNPSTTKIQAYVPSLHCVRQAPWLLFDTCLPNANIETIISSSSEALMQHQMQSLLDFRSLKHLHLAQRRFPASFACDLLRNLPLLSHLSIFFQDDCDTYDWIQHQRLCSLELCIQPPQSPKKHNDMSVARLDFSSHRLPRLHSLSVAFHTSQRRFSIKVSQQQHLRKVSISGTVCVISSIEIYNCPNLNALELRSLQLHALRLHLLPAISKINIQLSFPRDAPFEYDIHHVSATQNCKIEQMRQTGTTPVTAEQSTVAERWISQLWLLLSKYRRRNSRDRCNSLPTVLELLDSQESQPF